MTIRSGEKSVTNAILVRARELDIPTLAVIATDTEGSVIYWSVGAARLYGWTRDEAMGRNIMDLTPIEEVRSRAAEIMGHLRNGQSWSGEFMVKDKDGHQFAAEVTDIPVRGTHGELLGIIGVSRRIPDVGPG